MSDEQQHKPSPVEVVRPPSKGGRVIAPSTKMGWWAVYLAAAFIVAMGVNQLVFMNQRDASEGLQRSLLIAYGLGMMLCGLVSGVCGAIAVFGKKERSPLVIATLVPGLFVIVFLVGELLFPH